MVVRMLRRPVRREPSRGRVSARDGAGAHGVAFNRGRGGGLPLVGVFCGLLGSSLGVAYRSLLRPVLLALFDSKRFRQEFEAQEQKTKMMAPRDGAMHRGRPEGRP